jgi:CBS domain-containing protein
MGGTTLEKLGLGSSAPVSIGEDQLVAHCITELDAYQVSALPIVDDNGNLVGNFSVSDLLVSGCVGTIVLPY